MNDKASIRLFNDNLSHAQTTVGNTILPQWFDIQIILIILFSETSSADCEDLRVQQSYTVFYCDVVIRVTLVKYSRHKQRRLLTSDVCGEICALEEYFDSAYISKPNLESMVQLKIPTTWPTEYEGFFKSWYNQPNLRISSWLNMYEQRWMTLIERIKEHQPAQIGTTMNM